MQVLTFFIPVIYWEVGSSHKWIFQIIFQIIGGLTKPFFHLLLGIFCSMITSETPTSHHDMGVTPPPVS